MRLKRWVFTKRNAELRPDGVDGIVVAWGIRLTLPSGWLLVDVDVEDNHLRELQAGPAVVLPSLTAPASTLPTKALEFLDQQGVVLSPDDDVQQALRKLRDAKGFNFNIDKPF